MNFNELFRFEKTDGGYELVRFHAPKASYNVEIPGRYMGGPVLRIGEKAFENSRFLEEVYIPPEVKEIGNDAFFHCSRLCAVEFSEGLKKIGFRAFAECDTNLISLKFPKGLEYIDNYAFNNCWNLESVAFSDPGTKLGMGVFYRCLKLPAEAQLINILCSPDITAPLPETVYTELSEMRDQRISPYTDTLFREEVFALAVQNKCFRSARRESIVELFELLVKNGLWNLLRIAVDSEMLPDAGLTEKMIDVSSRNGQTELTALLLEYQRRKFGFDWADKFNL